ncbi:MAG TPA: NUDIX domain-containing protein [Burkholderiaceae bacterium]|nr:NUDIX domain-containing protein [Burkholderiaceae bacterium]
MPRRPSSGLLMYRRRASGLEVLLIHPGGPFWINKDVGAWSIPKGECEGSEEPLLAAQREFREETGWSATPPFLPLGSIRQRSGKVVTAWAFEGDQDPATLTSNTFEMEWPRGSRRLQAFPEADRAAWFGPDEARRRIIAGQVALIDELERLLAEQAER